MTTATKIENMKKGLKVTTTNGTEEWALICAIEEAGLSSDILKENIGNGVFTWSVKSASEAIQTTVSELKKAGVDVRECESYGAGMKNIVFFFKKAGATLFPVKHKENLLYTNGMPEVIIEILN